MRRPPGREALPRRRVLLPQPSARTFGQAQRRGSGGGSLTSLPIIETLEGEVSAYIPTNVISITDGQIYLQPDLFFAGIEPAMNVGISVSRVGGAAQIKADEEGRRRFAARPGRLPRTGSVRPARYRTRRRHAARLDRGYRMVELLKQGVFKPLDVVDQVLVHLRRHPRSPRQGPVNRVQEWEKSS